MSQWYTPKKTKGLYDGSQAEPFKLSRSKIEYFLGNNPSFFLRRPKQIFVLEYLYRAITDSGHLNLL